MAHSSQSYGSMDQRIDIPDVGFSPTELYNLSEAITSNIYTINSSWRTLERAYKRIGTNKDNQELRDKVHSTQVSTNQVVTQTSKDITRLRVVMRRGNKQQKLQIEKLTTDFKDALQRYSDMQKSIVEKMKMNILITGSIEIQNNDRDDDNQTLIQVQDQAAQRAETRTLEFERGLILEKEDRIKQIEGDILDVNQIMRDLGAMVQKQSDSVNTIESSIENVHANTELANEELLKASNYQSKFRRKMFFLLLIAFICALALVFIIVLTHKKS